jgi:hypothetical protein
MTPLCPVKMLGNKRAAGIALIVFEMGSLAIFSDAMCSHFAMTFRTALCPVLVKPKRFFQRNR